MRFVVVTALLLGSSLTALPAASKPSGGASDEAGTPANTAGDKAPQSKRSVAKDGRSRGAESGSAEPQAAGADDAKRDPAEPKDAQRKDGTRKDGTRKDSQRKDSQRKDGKRRDARPERPKRQDAKPKRSKASDRELESAQRQGSATKPALPEDAKGKDHDAKVAKGKDVDPKRPAPSTKRANDARRQELDEPEPKRRDAKQDPPDSRDRKRAKSRQRRAATEDSSAITTASSSGKRNEAPSDPFARAPKRPGYLKLQNSVFKWEGQALQSNGTLAPAALIAFSKIAAAWRSGDRVGMSQDLLRLLVQVSDHFGGRPIRVFSGYRPRSPTQYTRHSQHNLGRAVDFIVVGVPNTAVRDFCRTLPRAGVGYYPNSSFVHLDARGYPVYWVDFSGPGQPPRYADASGRDPLLSRDRSSRARNDSAAAAVQPATPAERPHPVEDTGSTQAIATAPRRANAPAELPLSASAGPNEAPIDATSAVPASTTGTEKPDKTRRAPTPEEAALLEALDEVGRSLPSLDRP